jgi:hypothetical protein
MRRVEVPRGTTTTAKICAAATPATPRSALAPLTSSPTPASVDLLIVQLGCFHEHLEYSHFSVQWSKHQKLILG